MAWHLRIIGLIIYVSLGMSSTWNCAWHLRIIGNVIYVLLRMTYTYHWAYHLRITGYGICAKHLRINTHLIYVLLRMSSTYNYAFHLRITAHVKASTQSWHGCTIFLVMISVYYTYCKMTDLKRTIISYVIRHQIHENILNTIHNEKNILQKNNNRLYNMLVVIWNKPMKLVELMAMTWTENVYIKNRQI